MRIEGFIFAGVASADAPRVAAFFRDVPDAACVEEDCWHRVVFHAPDGRVFELIDRRS